MSRAANFLLLLLQLALVLWVVHAFAIEERRRLPAMLSLALGGFLVHYWLPQKLRMPLFLALSLGSIGLVLDWTNAFWVVALGLGLIGICWLPASAPLRLTLLLLAAGYLAYWRSDSDHAFWPILGAMFMFRLIIYVFDTLHEQRPDVLPTLSYFFLLPNACFTLFPVIDYAAFRRTYYDEPEQSIYQTGVHWICRGLTHLLLYRWIKYHLLPAPHEIDDLPHLALFLAANYALYLRVSGQFHLITGLLHLFGFNLPRTHHLFFLATSFTDIWRRINIYWKDFMQKVFFMPVFFRLRGLGTVPAMLAATTAVFVATWLLHSYQHFWLLGEFPLSRNDALLWLSVGLLVAINGLADYRRARHAAEAPRGWSWSTAAINSLKAVGMFAAVSLFWGQWTYPQLAGSVDFERLTGPKALEIGLWMALLICATVVVGAVLQWLWRVSAPQIAPATLFSLPMSAVLNLLLLVAISLSGQTQLYENAAPELADVVSTLKQESFTPLEASQLVQGYYEEITDAGLQSQAFSGSGERAPTGQHVSYTDMTRPTGDMLQLELIPGWRGELNGIPLSVNRWGMRDRDLPRKKPAGTYRVALLGSSVVMGYGVRDDEVFDQVLEEQLNAAQAPGRPRIELLNFGTGRSFAIHRRLVLEQKALDFLPDAVYYFAHQDEFEGPGPHLAEIWYRKYKFSDPCLARVIQQTGVKPDTSWGLAHGLFIGQSEAIVRCSYERIITDCRSRGVLPVWIYLPMPGFADSPAHTARLAGLAKRAGFTVLDLSNWEKGYALEQIKLSAGDPHANAAGHRLIAERLWEAIQERPELLPALVPAKRESDLP